MTSSDNKLYVGNLGDNTSKKELEDIFFKYGPITNIWVARNPPGFAFVEYEDPRDAKDAIRALDGTRCCGTKLIVELSNGGRTRREGGGSAARRKQSPPIRRSRSRSPWKKTSRSRSRSRSKSFPARRSRSFSRDRSTAKKDDNGDSGRYREWDLSCKVYVGNLLNNASKNELEDVFSKYGPIRNVWVARNPPGFAFIEFDDPRDAEDAVRGLDGMRCCGTRIIVEMSNGKTRRGHLKRSPPGSRRSRSRSPWKRNSRARSRSLRSRSRSRSPLPRKDRSRSFSKERRRYLKKEPEDCEESYK